MSLQNTSFCRFGVFELDLGAAELRKNGVKLRLQDQPYQVLLKLIEHHGEIVSREELRSTLWHGDTFVDFETGLNTAIKRLRETLGDSADNPTFIETFPEGATNSSRQSKDRSAKMARCRIPLTGRKHTDGKSF